MSESKQLEEQFEVTPVVTGPNGLAGQLVVRQGTQLADCPTSLDLTTYKHKAWAVNASGESDYVIDTDKVVDIVATEFLLMPGESTDEATGEVSQFTWLVLFDNEGKFAKTTSQVMPKRVAQLLSVFTKEQWRDGIRCKLFVRKARKSGRMYHDLRVVTE